MTGHEFAAAGQALFGATAWKKDFAEALGCDRATVRRYAALGENDVPFMAALAVEALKDRKIKELQGE